MSDAKFAVYKASSRGILKDGHTMFAGDIAKDLNRKSYLEEQSIEMSRAIERLTAERDELLNNQAKRDLLSGAKHIRDCITYAVSKYPNGAIHSMREYANQLTKQAEGL